MQPFTHPDLIRDIHEGKIREVLEPWRDGNEGWSRRVVSGVRTATGGLLIAIGTRLAPASAPEGKMENVIDLSGHRATGRLGPDDVAEGENVTERKPAA